MNEKEKLIREKLNEEKISKIGGGLILKVNPPEDGPAKYKPYVVISSDMNDMNTRLIGQYDTFEEAWEKEKEWLKENIDTTFSITTDHMNAIRN